MIKQPQLLATHQAPGAMRDISVSCVTHESTTEERWQAMDDGSDTD